MLIYRYEDKNGYGPFTFGRGIISLTEFHIYLRALMVEYIDLSIHPEPRFMMYKGGIDKYNFGCASIEEINHWFNDEIQSVFPDCGFKLKVYDCPDEYCVREENQIGFIKSEADDITNSMREFVLK